MVIAIVAQDEKKEIMTEFCIAYCGILSKHKLCATARTGKMISEVTGLEIELLLSGEQGGVQQLSSRVGYNEIDMMLFFRNNSTERMLDPNDINLLHLCDVYNIPVATNIATAEALIMALGRGDLDWRDNISSSKK
ncbi:MAG: methylglyoxal synthase [Firmicutes bacterium]|nr:methylglyoxal synthase [Bacillota bacterium]